MFGGNFEQNTLGPLGVNLYWQERIICDIMYACITLRNMIIEDKRDNNLLAVDIPHCIST
jgi:hypothetical protein